MVNSQLVVDVDVYKVVSVKNGDVSNCGGEQRDDKMITIMLWSHLSNKSIGLKRRLRS